MLVQGSATTGDGGRDVYARWQTLQLVAPVFEVINRAAPRAGAVRPERWLEMEGDWIVDCGADPAGPQRFEHLVPPGNSYLSLIHI